MKSFLRVQEIETYCCQLNILYIQFMVNNIWGGKRNKTLESSKV